MTKSKTQKTVKAVEVKRHPPRAKPKKVDPVPVVHDVELKVVVKLGAKATTESGACDAAWAELESFLKSFETQLVKCVARVRPPQD